MTTFMLSQDLGQKLPELQHCLRGMETQYAKWSDINCLAVDGCKSLAAFIGTSMNSRLHQTKVGT